VSCIAEGRHAAERAVRKLIVISSVTVGLSVFGSSFIMAEDMKLPELKRQSSPDAVVAEHIDALNKRACLSARAASSSASSERQGRGQISIRASLEEPDPDQRRRREISGRSDHDRDVR
jgi:hypothetical protein